MIIAQISDTHIALDSEDSSLRIRDFETVIEDINSLDPQPHLVIHTGDIVHNGLAREYETAVSILQNLRVPIYAMVGNKDNRKEMRKAFNPFGFLKPESRFIEYEISGFPIHMIVLDTLCNDSNKGEYCEERIRNLSNSMTSNNTKSTLVFTHHPPFRVDVGPDPIHFLDVAQMKRLQKILEEAGNVIGVVSGHVHREAFGTAGTISCTVTTAVATTLRRGDYPVAMNSSPTYHIHRFDHQGVWSTETRVAAN